VNNYSENFILLKITEYEYLLDKNKISKLHFLKENKVASTNYYLKFITKDVGV
jgi:hypothetical protein